MKRFMSKKLTIILTSLILVSQLAGCKQQTKTNATATSVKAAVTESVTTKTTKTSAMTELKLIAGPLKAEYKEEDLNAKWDASSSTTIQCGSSVAINGSGAAEKNGIITISKAGTYVLSGNYNGQIIIEAGEKDLVHLILNSFTITNSNSSAIWEKTSDKVVITLAEGSKNNVTDAVKYNLEEGVDEPDAAIFTKHDLSINGTGTLNIKGQYGCGIRTKDDLTLVSGTINVTAVTDGIKGKDSVTVSNGTYIINAGDDAITATEDTDADKGYVIIDNGTFTLTSAGDAIHAETHLTINNGTINIKDCLEGLEGQMIDVLDGDITINAQDDGINAAKIGETSARAGKGGNPEDGGLPPDITDTNGDGIIDKQDMGQFRNRQTDTNGDGVVDEKDFGGKQIDTNGDGVIDDKDFAGRGPKGVGFDGGFRGGFGGAEGVSNENVYINISGGIIHIGSQGDCLDANGNLTISGGKVYGSINGTSIAGGGQGVIDADGVLSVSGDTFVATGSSGTASRLDSIKKNVFIVYLQKEQVEGTSIKLTDKNNKEIVSYNALRNFGSVLISGDILIKGETYTLAVGNTSQKITINDTLTTIGAEYATSGRGR